MVIVVGSPTSRNSNRLRELAERLGTDAYMVDSPEDLQPEWFEGKRQVGLTAGASAPDILVEQVIERLRALGAVSRAPHARRRRDDRSFPLPKGLGTSMRRDSARRAPRRRVAAYNRAPSVASRAIRLADAPLHARHQPAAQGPRRRDRRAGAAQESAALPRRGALSQRSRPSASGSRRATEELQARRNSLSKQIGMRKGKGEDATDLMAEVGGIGEQLKASAERLEVIQAELSAMLMGLPNLPHASVPDGADETATSRCGAGARRASYDFAVRDHVDLGAPLGLDFDTGAKLSGSRFSFLRGPGGAPAPRAGAVHARRADRARTATPSATRPTSSTARCSKARGSCPSSSEDMFWVTARRRRDISPSST